jgi:hypothetical protein
MVTMQIKFLAVGHDVPTYSFDGESVNGFDLSSIEHGDKFIGNDETHQLGIRDVFRDENGVLHAVLCQQVGPGHWVESDWLEADEYDPDHIYVQYLDKEHYGIPWARTAQGMVKPDGEKIE